MELIYLYIEKFNGIVKKQEINFSPNFDVKIIEKKLIVKNKLSYMDRLYPNNIKNITMLLGKNGSGKTTILDVLGMNIDDRCTQSIKRKGRTGSNVIDRYFILYHIQEDYFGIEIMDELDNKISRLFKDTVTNFDFNRISNPFYKIPMGLVIKKIGDNFQVVQHFFDKYPPLECKTSEKIGINYVSNRYSNRINTNHNYIGKDENGYEREGYLCKRRYYLKPSKVMQYKYINYLNSNKKLLFCGNLATVDIHPNFEYALKPGIENEEMEKWIENLENLLYIDKSDRINLFELFEDNQKNEKIKSKDDKKTYKKSFILDTLSSYIIYQFIKGICEIIDEKFTKNNIDNNVNINFINKETEFLENLKKEEYIQSNSNLIFGELLDKKKEYEKLIKVIDYYKQDMELNNYDKLVYISRYLYSRIEASIKLGLDSRYQTAIEKFLSKLNSLEDIYFHKKYISIKCNSELDKAVEEVFEVYDNYAYSNYNDIRMRFKLNFLNLSEGETNFLDLISKVFDIVSKTRDNQLSIILLDEADQSLHPKWSRKFIEFLCDKIKQYKNKETQIVLSTHSPFMATDIMSEHIYCLENINSKYNYCSKEESKISIYSMDKKKDRIHNTFGDNIHSLLKDGFIMDNTIGEFANQKIKDVAKDLTEKTAEDIIKEVGRKETIEYIIKNIGEPVIKRKLVNMYNKKFNHVEINNEIKELSNRVKELEKIIKDNGLV